MDSLELELAYHAVLKSRMHARRRGIVFGLEKTRLALDDLGAPDDEMVVIQVGGTNGKGSTTHMMAQLFATANKTIGVFTSPHLNRFSQRFEVNGVESAIEDLFNVFKKIERKTDVELTFFEWSTLVALVYFQAKKCNVVFLEVGMGGDLIRRRPRGVTV